MDVFKRLEPFALFCMIVGALNWGIVGLFDTNVLSDVFGTGTLTDVVYTVIGVAALMYVPRLMEQLHMGHGPHPRGV